MADLNSKIVSPTPSHLARETSRFATLLFSQKEAARILGISLRTLQNLIATRQIRVRRIGRRVLVHRKDLEAFARHDHPSTGGE